MTTLEKVRQRAESDAKTHGYYLNPDPDFLRDLLEGLKENEERYGYPSCPCRLASGDFKFDRDITCPCDYRDPDLEEYGACYCALYVNARTQKDLINGKNPSPIPERRPPEKQAAAYKIASETPEKRSKTAVVDAKRLAETAPKLWYCRQCGYVCFREEPPYVCPVCRAKKEMFAEIGIHTHAL